VASVSVGDIYLDRVRYQEDATKWKSRPIVILSVSEDVVVAVAASFTSVGSKVPPEYYDGYKFPVAHWSHANLNKPSWIKTYPGNLLELNTTDLAMPVGSLHPDDLVGLLDFLAEQE
jgi:hypothetical protein